eukprot:TRINITY_DN29639_c0_g1_i1.p2 TRINITY_DN29639_c0_g1~~TRINITY_DN29639_c0_g1_i1.p2  ORF type:complete len:111 (+),score=27.16 TRINITY_DN29639_c0_g1_i1:632-964(+)
MDVNMSEPAPAVNASIMQRYKGKRVRCVVKIEKQSPQGFFGETSDGQQVRVVSRGGVPYKSLFVEVLGIVDQEGGAIREESSVEFGDKFDMAAYNKLCELANNDYTQLFM